MPYAPSSTSIIPWYPKPPQGIYFESLVHQAFRWTKKPFALIEATSPNQPMHDLEVEGLRISLKTETGFGTRPDRISITKLCTTEREPWTATVLSSRVMNHLSRYDEILMLRAIWDTPLIHYQVVVIPMKVLRLIETADLKPVGRPLRRQSLGADVFHGEEKLFHVHFDGSDGKCQIRNLNLTACDVVAAWDVVIQPESIRTSETSEK